MKKRIFGAWMTAALAASMVLAVSAAEPTVDDILSRYQEASSENKAFTSDVTMDLDLTVSQEGSDDVNLKASGNVSLEATTDPIAEHLTGSYTYDLLGETGNGPFETYITVGEDGKLDTYASVTEGEWKHSSETDEDVAKFLQENGSGVDLTSLPFTYTLEGTEDVDGTQCYIIKAVITWDEISSLITQYAPDAADEDTLSTIGAIATGLQINLTTDINADTWQAVRTRVDMDGSDWSIINSLLGASLFSSDDSTDSTSDTSAQAAAPELTVNALYLEATYNYDNAPATITVPEEVVNSASEADVSSAVNTLTGDLAQEETDTNAQ